MDSISTSTRVRVIAGVYAGVAGAISREQTEPLYLDVHFEGTDDPAALSQALPAHHNALVYPYRGALEVCGAMSTQSVPEGHMGVLRNQGNGLVLRATPGTRAIVIAGQPLKEPIAQYGPFVMNTREELMQAVEDFRAGKFV